MQSLVAVAGAIQLAVVLVVGTRLLLLARRTRRLPELAIGMGFFTNALLGYPLLILSGWTRARVDEMSIPMVTVGCLLISFGMSFLSVFTWRVFRADARWAQGLVLGVSLLFFAQAVGVGYALAQAPAGARPDQVTHDWSTLQIALSGVCLGWAGLESLLYHRQLRRRLALGMADPVVANRVLLWAIYALSATFVVAVQAFYHLTLGNTLGHPVPLLASALGGSLSSGAVYLAFLPPASYLRLVQARAASAGR